MSSIHIKTFLAPSRNFFSVTALSICYVYVGLEALRVTSEKVYFTRLPGSQPGLNCISTLNQYASTCIFFGGGMEKRGVHLKFSSITHVVNSIRSRPELQYWYNHSSPSQNNIIIIIRYIIPIASKLWEETSWKITWSSPQLGREIHHWLVSCSNRCDYCHLSIIVFWILIRFSQYFGQLDYYQVKKIINNDSLLKLIIFP